MKKIITFILCILAVVMSINAQIKNPSQLCITDAKGAEFTIKFTDGFPEEEYTGSSIVMYKNDKPSVKIGGCSFRNPGGLIACSLNGNANRPTYIYFKNGKKCLELGSFNLYIKDGKYFFYPEGKDHDISWELQCRPINKNN